MRRQGIDVDGYWKVIVYYDMDYNLFGYVVRDVRKEFLSLKPNFKALTMDAYYDEVMEEMEEIYVWMRSGRAKAVTYSSLESHVSIVLFNEHEDRGDYLNSLVHEAEHVKQAMLLAYDVEDRGEEPAYTIGYLVERMWREWRKYGIISRKNNKMFGRF